MKKNIYFLCLIIGASLFSCDASKTSTAPSSGGVSVSPPAQNSSTNETPPSNNDDQEVPPMPNTATPPSGETNAPAPPKVDRSGLPKDCYNASKADSKMLCPDLLEPVCGCDGINYSNECEAKKLGVLKWTQGRCK